MVDPKCTKQVFQCDPIICAYSRLTKTIAKIIISDGLLFTQASTLNVVFIMVLRPNRIKSLFIFQFLSILRWYFLRFISLFFPPNFQFLRDLYKTRVSDVKQKPQIWNPSSNLVGSIFLYFPPINAIE